MSQTIETAMSFEELDEIIPNHQNLNENHREMLFQRMCWLATGGSPVTLTGAEPEEEECELLLIHIYFLSYLWFTGLFSFLRCLLLSTKHIGSRFQVLDYDLRPGKELHTLIFAEMLHGPLKI